MAKEYRAKVFKSGNSLALRLPKALGIEEGTEMILREDQAKFVFEPSTARKRKINVDRFWGKGDKLALKPNPDRELESRELDWDGKRLKHG